MSGIEVEVWRRIADKSGKCEIVEGGSSRGGYWEGKREKGVSVSAVS